MRARRILAMLMILVMIMAYLPGFDVYADSIGKEAQACKELGILIGADASGVTTQYLSTTPTRIQAFIILLRLKGLYSEATNYTGTDNFKDASTAGWAKNYMAYAKDHSELGWGGYPDGTFAPSDKISGQAFYKVMLETLGYKQNIDFAYADTLKFAQSAGLLKKVEDVANLKVFTINDVAKGIYGTLNTKPAGSDKKLISVMVEEGMVTPGKAVAAGFTLDTKDAKVVSFDAVTNNKLEVEFDQDINLQKADIEISQVGGSSRLSVLSVESKGSKAEIITTEAKPFNAYELTINTLVPTNNMVIRGYKKKFVAMPKDVVKPTVKHEVLGRNEILLTFSEEMDKSTSENLSNYTIENNVVVLSAALNPSGKAVLLKTTDMTSFYKLIVRNVTDIAGNRIDEYTALFEGAKKDFQGPSIVSVKSENNTTVAVTFDKRVDNASAENISNYSIDNNLSVSNARVDDSGKVVTLLTSVQQSGTIYKLIAQSVADTWGNVMYRKEYNFVGDNTRPTALVVAVSNNEVMVTFNKKMDKQSAENVENYMIDKGLQVKEAILDDTGKVVTLITSNQTLRELYTITIMQVTDLWGNMINLSSGKFGGMPADTRELSYTAKSKGNEIELTFNKRVDKETAEDVFNYTLDKELGYAAKATLDDSGRVVALLTANHSSGRMYEITVQNVKDSFGNAIDTAERVSTKKFVGIGSSESGSDGGTLNLETAVTVNVNTIDLIFSSELTEEELESMEAEVNVPEEYNHTLPSGIDCYKYFVGNKKNVRLQFKTSSSNNPELFKSGNIYEAEVTGIDRLNSKSDANVKMFAGTSSPNEAPRVVDVTAVNSTAVEVTFSEPVKSISRYQFDIKNGISISDASIKDSDEISDKVTLYLSSGTKLGESDYKLYVRSGVKDAAGLNAVVTDGVSTNGYVEFYGTSEVNEAPFIETDINTIDKYTLQFSFNEPIKDLTSGAFSVRKLTASSSSALSISKVLLSDDNKTVTVYLNSKYAGFSTDYEYELTISSTVADLQGLAVDSDNRKVQFIGADNEPEELEVITSYISEDNKRITLLTNRELNISSLSMDDFKLSGAGYYKSSYDELEYNDKSITLELKNELDANEELIIEITSAGRGKIKDYNNQELITERVEIGTN